MVTKSNFFEPLPQIAHIKNKQIQKKKKTKKKTYLVADAFFCVQNS
jgi:hypothetical protein